MPMTEIFYEGFRIHLGRFDPDAAGVYNPWLSNSGFLMGHSKLHRGEYLLVPLELVAHMKSDTKLLWVLVDSPLGAPQLRFLQDRVTIKALLTLRPDLFQLVRRGYAIRNGESLRDEFLVGHKHALSRRVAAELRSNGGSI